MALLDKYRGQGIVLIKALSPNERQELKALISRGDRGLRVKTTQAKVTKMPETSVTYSPKVSPGKIDWQGYKHTVTSLTPQDVIQIGGQNIIAFESIVPEPPPKSPAPPKLPNFAPMRIVPPPTKEEQKAMIERYSKKLEELGVPVKRMDAPPMPKDVPEVDKARQVLRGQVKAAFISADNVEQARKWGLIAFKVPHGSYKGIVAQKRAYILYRPGNAGAAKGIIDVLRKYPIGKRGPDYMTELGTVMGESPEAINMMINAFYGEESTDFEDDKDKPNWLGVISIVALAFFFLRGRSVTAEVSPPTQYLPEVYQLQGRGSNG